MFADEDGVVGDGKGMDDVSCREKNGKTDDVEFGFVEFLVW